MVTTLAIIFLIFLGIVSVIDWKFRSIPSVFLTGFLFVVVAMRFSNLQFGLLALLLALITYDIDQQRVGTADFKVMAMIGFLIPNMDTFFIFALIYTFFQFAYIFVFRSILKKKGEIPFIPCLYAVYIALFAIGGVL